MIEPNQSDIGLKVIFRVHGSAKVEEGVITRLNKKYVFVRFGKEEKSAVMTRDELEWKRSRSSDWRGEDGSNSQLEHLIAAPES